MASIPRQRSAAIPTTTATTPATPATPTPTARDLNQERVAVYRRVSSDEQAQAGTIQNQIEFARCYCDLHQLPIAEVYADEGVSGTVPMADRPAGRRMLADARTGKFGAVLVRIDRLARSTRVLLDTHDALKAHGVALRSMTEPFDTASPLGEFTMTLLGSLAALERATILERVTLGKHRAAREGRWLGGAPPYGYRVVDRRLVVHPEEAAVVRRIFQLYVHEGLGLRPLANLLNAEGVPAPEARHARRGGGTGDNGGGTKIEAKAEVGDVSRWTIGTLSRLLRTTAYAGRYRVGARAGKTIAEYEVPRIVDDATFAAAGRLLRERFIEASRNARRFYLLRGLITCHCGRGLVGDGRRQKQDFYYTCPHRHVRLRAKALETAVIRDIAGWARDPGPLIAQLRDHLRHGHSQAQDVAEELSRIQEQIAAKKGEQNAVITLYRKGIITEEQLSAQLDALAEELATLTAREQALFDRQVAAQAQGQPYSRPKPCSPSSGSAPTSWSTARDRKPTSSAARSSSSWWPASPWTPRVSPPSTTASQPDRPAQLTRLTQLTRETPLGIVLHMSIRGEPAEPAHDHHHLTAGGQSR